LSVKAGFLTSFALVALCAPPVFSAPYYGGQYQNLPQYNQNYATPQQPQQYQYQPQYQQGYQQQQYQQGYIPANQVRQMPQATSAGRITGSLPKVGNAYVNAGRKYYAPEGFDRLADSGLYLSLGIGYSTAAIGGMIAEYQNEYDAWYVPGAFQEAKFERKGSVMPIQLSVGAALNNDVRVDFSYLRYSGLSYPGHVKTSMGGDGFVDATVTDGRISSTATMLNIYYNLDSYTGILAGGALRPYVGAGLGIGTNTIADYVIYDGTFYPAVDYGDYVQIGDLTGVNDIYAYHSGGTTEQMAFSFEGGVTTELEGGLKIDFFARWVNLGKVQSSGSIVVTQTEWLANAAGPFEDGMEEPGLYDAVFHYTDWKEGGKLTTLDIGVRLRIQF